MIKKGFTLVELTITIIILAILIGAIFEIFIMISHIAVKVKNEKMIHDEVMYISQTIQNIVDKGTTSFTGYNINASNHGYEDVLNLTDNTFLYSFFLSGDVLYLRRAEVGGITEDIFPLSSSEKVDITKFFIKRVPYKDQTQYDNIMHEGFWLFLEVQTPFYDEEKRWHRVDWSLQTFYNIRVYD